MGSETGAWQDVTAPQHMIACLTLTGLLLVAGGAAAVWASLQISRHQLGPLLVLGPILALGKTS